MRFTAESDEDGVNLKTAVLNAARAGFTPAAVIEQLDQIGYELTPLSPGLPTPTKPPPKPEPEPVE
jgi:hypothetical protein